MLKPWPAWLTASRTLRRGDCMTNISLEACLEVSLVVSPEVCLEVCLVVSLEACPQPQPHLRPRPHSPPLQPQHLPLVRWSNLLGRWKLGLLVTARRRLWSKCLGKH